MCPQSSVVRSHHGPARFRGGAHRFPPARGVEDAAMGGGHPVRGGGRSAGVARIERSEIRELS